MLRKYCGWKWSTKLACSQQLALVACVDVLTEFVVTVLAQTAAFQLQNTQEYKTAKENGEEKSRPKHMYLSECI